MKKYFTLLLALISLSNFTFSKINFNLNSDEAIRLLTQVDNDKENYTLKMAQAKIKMGSSDYKGALRIFKRIYEDYKEDANLNNKMGICYLKINDFKEANNYFLKANNTNPNIDKKLPLNFGIVNQKLGKLDMAIEFYESYKSSLKAKFQADDRVNDYIAQCKTAKQFMANPSKAIVVNIGNGINSKYTDAAPSITADSKTMIFTSRRPDSKGTNVDPYTGGYYDDVYISSWDNAKNEWAKAKLIPGEINTSGHDANLSISPDGNTIFLYKNIIGETKSGDIYKSVKGIGNEWGKPTPLGKNINSSYFESSACITADGNTLYFVSEREREGYGSGDIYYSTREGNRWSKPINMGEKINTQGDEIGVFIHPDGKTLFFSSTGHNSMGEHDIFMSEFIDGTWSTPLNMGYPINTIYQEYHFVLSTDGKTAYISSNRKGGLGNVDIYKVDLTNYFTKKKALSTKALTIIRGSIVNDDAKPIVTEVVIKDLSGNEKDLVIKSNEKGGYFATLPSDHKYKLTVETKGYKTLEVEVLLSKGENGETNTITKHLILNKK